MAVQTHACTLPDRDPGYAGADRKWECDLCGAWWMWVRHRHDTAEEFVGQWELLMPAAVGVTVREGDMISELGARVLWRAMGEGPYYSPSWNELLERATALKNITQHCEEEHGGITE